MLILSDAVQAWLRTGERGLSSECIVEVMEGLPIGTITGRWLTRYPLDPSDLRRCVLLLEAVPSYRERLSEMSIVSKEWAALVAHWDELVALLREECGPNLGFGRAMRTYDRMQELIN